MPPFLAYACCPKNAFQIETLEQKMGITLNQIRSFDLTDLGYSKEFHLNTSFFKLV
jgi:hypothetical protein